MLILSVNINGQDLMNAYFEPVDANTVALNYRTYDRSWMQPQSITVDRDGFNYTISLCWGINESLPGINLNPYVSEIDLLNGPGNYQFTIELYVDNNWNNCQEAVLTDAVEMEIPLPYNPTATTWIPDPVLETHLEEDIFYGDGILGNQLVYTHRIENLAHLFLNGYFSLIGTVTDLSNLSDFPRLKVLYCSDQEVPALDTTGHPDLRELWFDGNPIQSIDLSQNPLLEFLHIGHPELQGIDLTHNPLIDNLTLSDIDQIIAVDLSQNLAVEQLYVSGNQLPQLDLSNQASITYLSLHLPALEALDLSSQINLRDLFLTIPVVSSLDLSSNTNLESFQATQLNMPQLDLSPCPILERVNVEEATLQEITVTGLEELFFFGVYFTDLTSIDLSTNPALETVFLFQNELTSLDLRNGNNANIESLNTIANDLLYCISVDNPEEAPYSGWSVDSHTGFSTDCSLAAAETMAIEVSLYPNPAADFIRLQTELPLDTVQIFDLSGKLVGEAATQTIDVSKLPTGLYLLKATSNYHTFTKQFVKR